MSLKAKFKKNAVNPKGFLGTVLISRMNIGTHYRLAQWGLGQLKAEKGYTALDVGCGGGANVEKLLGLCCEGSVTGIDCSETSVKKSLRLNKKAVKDGRCQILKADVSSLPFADGSFDIATAFETVYFWQEIEKAFSEVYRVLKKGGSFLVTNETEGNSASAQQTLELIENMKFYTAKQTEEIMQAVGFKDIKIFRHPTEAWFSVVGTKN